MKNKKLGILIPTRNRSRYLNELLSLLLPQTVGKSVIVYVRDNDSDDDTALVVASFQKIYENLKYHKNDINVGGDVNFLLMVNACSEEYFWIFGDDELISINGVDEVFRLIDQEMDYIVFDGENNVFNSLSDYVGDRFSGNPYRLIYCTLITCNVIKRSVFNIKFATTKYTTHYGHMYGIIDGLKNGPVKILSWKRDGVFSDRGRNVATPVDNDWPKHLEQEWNRYLRYLAEVTGLRYPWVKVGWINTKRFFRHWLGLLIPILIGKKMKLLIQKYILRRFD